MATEKIFVQIGNEKIELTGQAKEDFIADQKIRAQEASLRETARIEKETARASAITKLAEIAGLTEEEINAII